MVSFAFTAEQEAFRETLDSYARRIHGNLGYPAELPLQQRHRDVMAYLVADGTAEIQKNVIAREAYRRGRAWW